MEVFIIDYTNKDTNKVYKNILFVIIYVILAITVYAISYELTLSNHTDKELTTQTPQNTEPIETTPNTTNDTTKHLPNTTQEYTVKDSNGKIAIYKNTDPEPFIILDIYTNSLPFIDQQDILQGLTIIGDENLQNFIEDFDS